MVGRLAGRFPDPASSIEPSSSCEMPWRGRQTMQKLVSVLGKRSASSGATKRPLQTCVGCFRVGADVGNWRIPPNCFWVGRSTRWEYATKRERHDQNAAALYPTCAVAPDSAQPSRAATGNRARPSRYLDEYRGSASVSNVDRNRPWWFYYQPHKEDADALMNRMRQIGSISTQQIGK